LNRVRGLTVAYTPISSTVKQCKLDRGPAQGYEFVVAFAAPTNSSKFCNNFLLDFGLQAPATLSRAYILGYYWQPSGLPVPLCALAGAIL
jgi:hypothetical protein